MRRVLAVVLLAAVLAGTQPGPAAFAAGTVGTGACTGCDSCASNSGNVGDTSCNESQSCASNAGRVGSTSCNAIQACVANQGRLGDNSCNGIQACVAYAGTLGVGSCNGLQACDLYEGNIGASSCNGAGSCYAGTGKIGTGSCNGTMTCASNSGTIGAGSCNRTKACTANTGQIDDGLCNTDVACANNAAHISRCSGNGISISTVPGCWFLGDPGESCADVCRAEHLAYGATALIGSAAPDGAACGAVFGLFGPTSTPTDQAACSAGLGCYATGMPSALFRCTDPATDPDAAAVGARRLCACAPITPAPAASHRLLIALAVVLLGLGALSTRRRSAHQTPAT